jgi:hypothetical protein
VRFNIKSYAASSVGTGTVSQAGQTRSEVYLGLIGWVLDLSLHLNSLKEKQIF